MSEIKDVLTKVARYPWDEFSVQDGKAYLSTSEGDVFVVKAFGEGGGHTGFYNASKALEICKVGDIKADGTTVTIGRTKIELEPGAAVPDGFDFDHAVSAAKGSEVIPEFTTMVAAAAPVSSEFDAFKNVAWDEKVVIATDGIRIHGIEYQDKLTETTLYTNAALMRFILRLKPEKFAVYPEGVYFVTPQWAALLAHRDVKFPDWRRLDKKKGWAHYSADWSSDFSKWFVKVLKGLSRLSSAPKRGVPLRLDFTDSGVVVMGWDHSGSYEWHWTIDVNLAETGLVGTAWDSALFAELLAHVSQSWGPFDIWKPKGGGETDTHKFQSKAPGPKPFVLLRPLRV